MNDNYSRFCSRLNSILKELDISKQALADRAGISISFLSDLTNGKANPSLEKLGYIAEALGIPLALFFQEENSEAWKGIMSVVQHNKNKESGYRERSNKSSTPIKKKKKCKKIPEGYALISAILPEHKAFLVSRWASETSKQLKKNT